MYKLFSLAGGRLYYKQNFAEFLVEFQILEIFSSLARCIGWVGILDFKRTKISNALRILGWVPENWDPVKDTRWLPRVDSPNQGVTSMVILELNL